MSKQTRNPLDKLDILHVPGYSTQQKLYEAFMDKVCYWVLLASVSIGYFFAELIRYWLNVRITVLICLIVVMVIVGLSCYRIWRNIAQLKALKLGWKGEVATGQLLETLRQDGYVVLHDLQTKKKGNIDHVVIGPAGIFAIETKTISMPVDDKAVITIGQNDQLIIDGRHIAEYKGRNPLNQSRRSSELLGQMIFDSSGRKLPVKSVLVYPGWWINENPKCDVMVLNPKRFITLIKSMPVSLSGADVRFVERNLIRTIQTD